MKRYIRNEIIREELRNNHELGEKFEARMNGILEGAVNDIVNDIYVYTPLDEDEDERADGFVTGIESDDEVLNAETALLEAIKRAYHRWMGWIE